MQISQKTILAVTNLNKTFTVSRGWFKKPDYFTAVNNISFTLGEQEILGLLGPNGAGKTTTIQILLSLMTPTSGAITYFGKDFFTHRSEILQHVSFASTYVKLPGRLTIFENLDIYGRLYGLNKARRLEKIEKYLKFFGMWNLKDKETGVLSAGQLTRVMLAKAFISDPRIVLLDEPTAALDPDIAYDVRTFVKEQKNRYGVSILFTSHNMDEVTEVCDRVLVLQKGNIIANASPAQLASSVSTSRIDLIVPEQLPLLEQYLTDEHIIYKIESPYIKIELDESRIAQLLIHIARLGVTYSYVAIEKPTLEDYFLQIAQQTRTL
jgi:ABC-2 type transport system ATP-binding protein